VSLVAWTLEYDGAWKNGQFESPIEQGTGIRVFHINIEYNT